MRKKGEVDVQVGDQVSLVPGTYPYCEIKALPTKIAVLYPGTEVSNAL